MEKVQNRRREKDVVEKKEKNKRYMCLNRSHYRHGVQICGYIYDPEKGDPDSGIPPGTPFEELPGDWVCSICGASKEDFEEVK